MSVQFGSALLVSCCVLFFAGAVWVTASLLWKSEIVQASAQHILDRTRSRLDAAMIASEVGTWEWDIRNDRVFADKNLAAMFGVSEIDATGGPLASYVKSIHPDDVSSVQQTIKIAVVTGDSYNCQYRLARSTGERWVLARGKVERDAAGMATRLAGVVLDFTEQRKAEFISGKVRLDVKRVDLAAIVKAIAHNPLSSHGPSFQFPHSPLVPILSG